MWTVGLRLQVVSCPEDTCTPIMAVLLSLQLLVVLVELPLQLHGVFPRQAGGAVTHSLARDATGAELALLEGGDSLLNSRDEALHSQICNTVCSCAAWFNKHKPLQSNSAVNTGPTWQCNTLYRESYQYNQQCPWTRACWQWAPLWLGCWCPCSRGTWWEETPLWYGPAQHTMSTWAVSVRSWKWYKN